jgi:enolase
MRDYIVSIRGREILNSRGKPTVEANLETSSGIIVTASVPSGTSTGKYEAKELFDGEERYNGYGTKKASANVSGEINNALKGMSVTNQREIDYILVNLDGTLNKGRLGSNAILAASIAAAKAGALSSGVPMYQYLGGQLATKIPDIASTVISGGAFSPSGLEFEDYLIIIEGMPSFAESVEALCRIRKNLKQKCINKYRTVAEDGGALAPNMESTKEALETMLAAAREEGCEKFVKLGLDVAANELFLKSENVYQMKNRRLNACSLSDYYRQLVKDYPLIYIEDPFTEEHWEDFASLTQMLPNIQIVGDDLYATNANRLSKGISMKAGNTLLLKINQSGTVTETIEAACLAIDNNIKITASLR